MLAPTAAPLRCAARSLPRSLIARRNASTSSHNDGEDYRMPESFANVTWRNTVLAGLAIAAFCKYAPEPSEDAALTQFMSFYTASRERLLEINAKHTALSQQTADDNLLLHDAKKPSVQRYRYPQAIGQASPFLTPIGMTVDMSDIRVKTSKEISF